MKRKLRKYLEENNRVRELTISDFEAFLKYKNKNDRLVIDINQHRFIFDNNSAFFSLIDEDGEASEWRHVFLHLFDDGSLITTPEYCDLVKGYIKDVYVNPAETFKKSIA